MQRGLLQGCRCLTGVSEVDVLVIQYAAAVVVVDDDAANADKDEPPSCLPVLP